MPIALRWKRCATRRTVPLPANGSRTVDRALPVLSGQEQRGEKPRVIFSRCTILPVLYALATVCLPEGSYACMFCARMPLSLPPVDRILPYSTTRPHAAPQCSQACALLPARIHGATSASGIVA